MKEHVQSAQCHASPQHAANGGQDCLLATQCHFCPSEIPPHSMGIGSLATMSHKIPIPTVC